MSTTLAQEHPDLNLLTQVRQRPATAQPESLTTTNIQAIAATLQSPAHLDGLQETAPPLLA